MRTIRNVSFVALLAAIAFTTQPVRAQDCESYMSFWCNWSANGGGFGFACGSGVDIGEVHTCCYVYCSPGGVEDFWYENWGSYVTGQCDCQ
jgi:hypothetical protein